jgi:hypothetical protein
MEAIELHQKHSVGAKIIPELVESRIKQQLKNMMIAELESELTKFEKDTQALSTSAAKILKQQLDTYSEMQILLDEYMNWRTT